MLQADVIQAFTQGYCYNVLYLIFTPISIAELCESISPLLLIYRSTRLLKFSKRLIMVLFNRFVQTQSTHSRASTAIPFMLQAACWLSPLSIPMQALRDTYDHTLHEQVDPSFSSHFPTKDIFVKYRVSRFPEEEEEDKYPRSLEFQSVLYSDATGALFTSCLAISLGY